MKFYFDFEANQFTEHIISVGVAAENGEAFFSFVGNYPGKKKEKITKFITELTGITQETYDNAPTADYVFSSVHEWINSNLPDEETPEYYCYGDCDVKFIEQTLHHITNFSAFTFLTSLKTSIVNYAPVVAQKMNRTSVGLQRIYNFLKEEENKQKHSSLEDAFMLKYVMENIDKVCPVENLPKAPEVKTCYSQGRVSSFPTGKFYIRGIGKHATEREFANIHEAMEWLISNRIGKKERDCIHRDRMALKIMKAIRKNETYMNYRWRREKENKNVLVKN